MLKLVDLSYFADKELNSVLDIYPEVTGYAFELKDKYNCHIIRHLKKEEEINIKGVIYKSFTSKNNFFYIPFKTHRYLKKLKPDIVIIQGFAFPLQTIFLRAAIGKKAIIMLQYRQGGMFRLPKKSIQQLADKYINAYLFTAKQLAESWLQEKIIAGEHKCYELQGASVNMTRQEKELCRQKLSISGSHIFLWVGRLNENKDPICVIKAFQKYIKHNCEARLYMIYQENKLEAEINGILSKNKELKNAVKMVGKVGHSDLIYWYSAADFYISASHNESTGFALLESLACGCIPVVTHIAAYQKMLEDGKTGYFFEPGNAENLLDVLLSLQNINKQHNSIAIENHFKKNLSFSSIANKLDEIVSSLIQ